MPREITSRQPVEIERPHAEPPRPLRLSTTSARSPQRDTEITSRWVLSRLPCGAGKVSSVWRHSLESCSE